MESPQSPPSVHQECETDTNTARPEETADGVSSVVITKVLSVDGTANILTIDNAQSVDTTAHTTLTIDNTQSVDTTAHTTLTIDNTQSVDTTAHTALTIDNTQSVDTTAHTTLTIDNTQSVDTTAHTALTIDNTQSVDTTAHTTLTIDNTQSVDTTAHTALTIDNTQSVDTTAHTTLTIDNTQSIIGAGHTLTIDNSQDIFEMMYDAREKWRNIGGVFHLSQSTLNNINVENQNNDDKLRSVITEWLNKYGGTEECTWTHVAMALRNKTVAREDLAREVFEQYPQPWSVPPPSTHSPHTSPDSGSGATAVVTSSSNPHPQTGRLAFYLC